MLSNQNSIETKQEVEVEKVQSCKSYISFKCFFLKKKTATTCGNGHIIRFVQFAEIARFRYGERRVRYQTSRWRTDQWTPVEARIRSRCRSFRQRRRYNSEREGDAESEERGISRTKQQLHTISAHAKKAIRKRIRKRKEIRISSIWGRTGGGRVTTITQKNQIMLSPSAHKFDHKIVTEFAKWHANIESTNIKMTPLKIDRDTHQRQHHTESWRKSLFKRNKKLGS